MDFASLFKRNTTLGVEILNNIQTPSEQLPVIKDSFGKKLVSYLELDINNGPWLAGGIVRKIYTNESLKLSDWDIWVTSPTQYGIVYNKLHALTEDVISTINADTFKIEYNQEVHSVQVIRNVTFDNVTDLLNQFDFTICQLATDGNTTILGEHTAADLRTKTIRLTDNTVRKNITSRLVKYVTYGYKPSIELYNQMIGEKTSIDWRSTNEY